jgi:O-acetyl-ADP-ribose deacetylase
MIAVIHGDITTYSGDAIVNAANKTLLGGGGVDGAIHRAGGPEILMACRHIGGCGTGEAVITTAGRMKTRYVIHTVGPVWHGGQSDEPYLLANCYRNSLCLAQEKGIKSLAFPNISTGIYGYPKALAADIAIREVLSWGKEFNEILFYCFESENYRLYREKLQTS